MLVPFEQLSNDARVWVFQSILPMRTQQKESLLNFMNQFCTQWQSHGNELMAGYRIERGHFLIVGVDESNKDASGCSIDKLFQGLNEWQTVQGLDFFDRKFVAFIENDQVKFETIQHVKSNYKSGNFSDNTLIFNTLTNTKTQFNNSFVQPISESWIGAGLQKVIV